MEGLSVAIATIVGAVFAGFIGAWVQGRFQSRQMRELERKAEQRLGQLEVAYARLDPVNSVRLLFGMKQYPAAVELASAVLKTEPEKMDAYYLRGLAYAQLHETEKAVADLRSATTRTDDRPDIQLALGLSEFALGNWVRAADAARRAVAGEVDDRPLALTLLGDALRAQKLFDEAIGAYQQCLVRNPKHTPAIDGAGQAMLKLAIRGTGSYDRAVEWYDKYIDANPTASSTYIGRAVLLFKRNCAGDRDKSFKDLERARALAGAGTQPYETAGTMFVNLAEEETDGVARRTLAQHAVELYTQALNRASRNYAPAIRSHLAYAHELLGNYADATQEAQTSVDQSPGFPANHQALVCALMASHHWREAISHCNQWLHSEHAAQSLPGRIWIGGWLCLARLANEDSPEDVKGDLRSFCYDLQSMPEFSPTGWRWSVARDRLLEFMERKGNQEELVKDVIALLKREIQPEEFQKRYHL